jgi:hypothetical protein
MLPLTTYTNQRVSFQKDAIFGWCVLAEHGWMPLSQLDKTDMCKISDLVDNMSIFPDDLLIEIRRRIS